MTKPARGAQAIGSLITDALIGHLRPNRPPQSTPQPNDARQRRPINPMPSTADRLSEAQPASTAPTAPPTLPSSQSDVGQPGDVHPDYFVPTYDLGTKDSRNIMDVAVFRLSKKNRRAGDTIRYQLSDGTVTVTSGPHGMASVWDYDLVLMAISQLTEAMNRYRAGRDAMPGRVLRPHVADVLKFCRRSDGGKQKDDLVETCLRLNTTHVAVERSRTTKSGGRVTVSEGEALISRYKLIKSESGKPEFIEIEIADWMYREITQGNRPEVLTVHSDYFKIDSGIGRFVYRLARRSAGKRQARWSFETIFERSGSTGTFNKFSFTLRNLIKANHIIPEYELSEESGKMGPILLMRHRDYSPETGNNS